MGLLRDQYYWAGVLNAVELIASDVIDPEAQAEQLAKVGCQAFSKLIEDPDLREDLESGNALVEGIFGDGLAHDILAFRRFLFIEERVFLESGASEGATRSLLRQLLDVREDRVSEKFSSEHFTEQLSALARIFCSGRESIAEFESRPKLAVLRRSRWEVTKKTVSGVFVMSANLGCATAAGIALPVTGVAGGLVAGYSVEYGRKLWMQAWRGEW